MYQPLSFSLQCRADSGNIHYDENFGRKKKAQFWLLVVFQRTGGLLEFDSCLTFFYQVTMAIIANSLFPNQTEMF